MKLILMMILFLVTDGQISSCDKTSPLNKIYTLKYGQTIEIKEEKLKIKFVSVVEDSRCPQGEQCIREGNGKIMLEILTANGKEEATLNTSEEPREIIYQRVGIKVTDFQPYPKSNVEIKSNDYVISLQIFNRTEQEKTDF